MKHLIRFVLGLLAIFLMAFITLVFFATIIQFMVLSQLNGTMLVLSAILWSMLALLEIALIYAIGYFIQDLICSKKD